MVLNASAYVKAELVTPQTLSPITRVLTSLFPRNVFVPFGSPRKIVSPRSSGITSTPSAVSPDVMPVTYVMPLFETVLILPELSAMAVSPVFTSTDTAARAETLFLIFFPKRIISLSPFLFYVISY